MRNVKKFLALVLAMLMVVSAAATVSAFEDVADDHAFAAAINDLTVKEIVNGYDGETFGPDDAVTRQQMALMMARAITGNVGDDAVWAQGGLVGFEDVTEYQYAIATVVKAGIVDGFLDNTFRPEEGITFVQALKMAVCALGYDDGNLEWWNGYYNVALDLGLTENLNYITDADKALNRGEVAQLIYNMLYIDLADGSDCFASQNFGLATATNLTTFIITATDEQTAYEGMDVAEGGYVGLQTLVNGVPEGDVIYVPVEMFGFEDDEDEAAFLSAYNLVNWDEDEGTFDQIIPVGESWKIYNTEISVNTKAGKFSYDGKNYYAVEELSGTAIKNEVVLYNSTDFDYDDGNKQLFLNAKGEVLGAEGEVVLEAVYSVTGNIVSYLEVATGKYLSIANATSKYGEVIDDVAQSYTIVDEAWLTGAYELTVFDDDMDGKMDRAYWTPVYMAVKNGFTSTDKHLTEGPFEGWDEGDDGKISGMEDLAKGDVFVYTFNKQLAEVTVLEVLEVQEAVVDYVSTLKMGDSYFTINTTAGDTLTVYNGGKNDKVGAAVQATATAPAKMTDITTDAKFGYVDVDTLLDDLTHSIHIKYFERNGIVIFAETYNPEDVFDRIVVKEVVDADIGTLYAEAYVAGELEEIPVTAITVNGKTVDLTKLTWLQMGKYLDALEEGGVYRMVELEDGYLLSDVLDYTGKATTATKDNAAAFKLYAPTFTKNTITITDGVVDSDCATKANRLRTNENTVWYFINGEEVYVFQDLVEEGKIVLNTQPKTYIYANKVGYSGDNKGVASEVYVFDVDLDKLEGFGMNKLVAANVYIPYLLRYEYDTAEVFGLDEDEYTEIGYYKYASAAIDLDTGDTVTVYATKKLTSADMDKVYAIDANGVILDDQSNVAALSSNTKVTIDVEDEFITLTKNGSVWYNLADEIDTVIIANAGAKLADTKKSTVTKAADVKKAIEAAELVNFVPGMYKDGTLVFILSAKPVVTDTTAKVSGADVIHSTHDYVNYPLEATVEKLSTANNNVAATITVYNSAEEVEIGETFHASSVSANTCDNFTVKMTKLADNIAEDDVVISQKGQSVYTWDLSADSTFVNGVLTLKGFVNPNSSAEVFTEAGDYKADIACWHGDAYYTVTLYFTIVD